MKKLNLFDFLIMAIVLLLGATLVLVFIKKSTPFSGKPMTVTVRISQNHKIIESQVKQEKVTYFDSINKPLEQVAVKENPDSIDITIKGIGQIEKEKYLFESMRILIGQKAELHSSYFAQGIITEIKYAD